ncbi:hypothetical protein RJT34_16501 [Clitoria ternatea]|uniref:DNA2/NAM7 helicase helicase domain-containing protein n=1 Tax=Clitoria ternatea TaxID=43366 RepID=A0AAN9PCA8_CLITE
MLKKSFNKGEIMEFCFQNSSLIFCTTSALYRLHSIAMKPPNILVIDEAAQLKEWESLLPMLLPELSHAILIGDECQLSSMVWSNVTARLAMDESTYEFEHRDLQWCVIGEGMYNNFDAVCKND